MSRVFFTAKIAAMAAFGTAGSDLLEGHNISVSTVGAVLCVVVPGAWMVARKLTKLEDAVKSHGEFIKSLPCQHPDCPTKQTKGKT